MDSGGLLVLLPGAAAATNVVSSGGAVVSANMLLTSAGGLSPYDNLYAEAQLLVGPLSQSDEPDGAPAA